MMEEVQGYILKKYNWEDIVNKLEVIYKEKI